MESKLKDYAVTKLLEEGLLGYFGNDDIIKSSESNIIIFIRENRETEIVKSISYAACLLYCKFEIDYNNLIVSFEHVDGYLYDDYWMGVLEYKYITCNAKAHIFDVLNIEVSKRQHYSAVACYLKERAYLNYVAWEKLKYDKLKYRNPLDVTTREELSDFAGITSDSDFNKLVEKFSGPLYKYLPADRDISNLILSWLKRHASENTRVYLSEAILYDCILYYRISIYVSKWVLDELRELYKDIVINKVGNSGMIEMILPKDKSIYEKDIKLWME